MRIVIHNLKSITYEDTLKPTRWNPPRWYTAWLTAAQADPVKCVWM